MKYFKLLLFSTLMIISIGSDSDILDLSNSMMHPINTYRDIKQALETISKLKSDNAALEEKLNETSQNLSKVIQSQNFQIVFLSGINQRQKSDIEQLKGKLEEARNSASSRLVNIRSMYGLGDDKSSKDLP